MPSARRAAMKARTSAGVELGEARERRRAAEMLGEEGEELADVAPIGLDRLGRHAPLGAEEARASARSRRATSGAATIEAAVDLGLRRSVRL